LSLSTKLPLQKTTVPAMIGVILQNPIMEERQMNQVRKPHRLRPQAKSLWDSMRDFLTPEVFKQVRKAANRRKSPRWDLHPLLYILLLSTWCCGDSLPEKFEAAKAFYVAGCPKRKRPGTTFPGFEKAMAKLPMPVLRTLAAALRGRIEKLFNARWQVKGFVPLGCDGSRLECPRSEALEKCMGTSGKEGAAPMLWNTSIVHLALGVPWCWRWGLGGKASERSHLIFMLKWLPKLALVVTDAGYVGYEVVRALVAAEVCFLIRMSSNATFYADEEGRELSPFHEGIVYYWPKTMRDQGKPPLRGRLMRICSPRTKHDVWLFTNVEEQERLPAETAGLFYRWRWENEGFFRTYKRTMKKLKLMSRTVRLVHREAEASMLATQLLLCQGALAMPVAKEETLPVLCSPRRVLLEIRKEIACLPRTLRPFGERIAQATREYRVRTSSKEKREWPRRKPHQPPNPPAILTLTAELKALILKHLQITVDAKT
jgi:hypothetical protein